jgi:hypothetical protein
MPGGVAFADLAPVAAGGVIPSVVLGPIPDLSEADGVGGEFLAARVRSTPWPAEGLFVVFPPGTAGVHVVVVGRAGAPPRYYVAGTRGFRAFEADNSVALGPDDFVDAPTARSRLAADPPPTPRWSALVTQAALATGILGGIGGANLLVLREGDSPRILEAARAQFKKALARPLPQPATSVYPGRDHFVAALERLNPRGKFWVAPDGRSIEVKTLLDACEVGTDLWRFFRPDPEKATPGDPLVASYAELAPPWWERQLEKQRAEIREFLRATGEFTYDRHGRVHTVESRDQHGTPIVKKWRPGGKRELVKLPRSTECFKQDKEGHPALDDLPGLQAELEGYAARASKTLKAPPGNWTARFAQLPCLVDPARPWSAAQPLKYKKRLQLAILAAAVERRAGLGEPMLAAFERIAADHQSPDELADRVAQLRIAAASYATAKHENKNPVQRCGPDCVKCCAQLVAGPDKPVGDTADLGQWPLVLDVIRWALEGPPEDKRPPPPTPPAVPKPVAFAARRPSSTRAKRPIPRRSSSVLSLDKRPRLGSVGSGGPSPTAGSQRSLSASSWPL